MSMTRPSDYARPAYADQPISLKGDQIAQDCVQLDQALARWLGPRLNRMTFSHSFPLTYRNRENPYKEWITELRVHGDALMEYGGDAKYDCRTGEVERNAIKAMEFVAKNLIALWD